MNDPKLKLGTAYCLCRTCGSYFGGVASFDLHRRDMACLPPGDVADRKGRALLKLTERGYWVKSLSDAQKASLRGAP